MIRPTPRRALLLATLGASLVGAAGPLRAQARRQTLPSMTDGPFYPPRRWRLRDPSEADWDADLTRVKRGTQTFTASGEHLALMTTVVDARGRALDEAEVEIWQCDAKAVYHHPDVRVADGASDPGFQGFGAGTTGKDGTLRFRTIRPVPYPGRTPHIHIKLRHPSFGEWTSQLFVAGDPGNERDFLWRGLSTPARNVAAMQLQAVRSDDGLRWQAQQALVVPD
ncbi:MAG: intradiol ring-cleavage dioxygenase [Rubrivivax sp.]|nr:intradiol ring-cleavage dioxygenase [Rubrivivax sp.]